ncbi:AAA family ATPase [Pseudomonadota bacterium]
MIRRIEAYKYRCFDRLDLELGHQQVLAGSNGSGKTTLLDIVSLISDVTKSNNVNDAFFFPCNGRDRSRAERARELIFNLSGETFTLILEIYLPQFIQDHLQSIGPKRFRDDPRNISDCARYEIAFSLDDQRINVSEEHLILFSTKVTNQPDHGDGLQGVRGISDPETQFHVIERSLRHKAIFRYEWRDRRSSNELSFAMRNTQSALSILPADEEFFTVSLWVQEFLLDGAFCYEPSWPVMRLASSSRDRNVFRSDGGSLAWQIYEIQHSDEENFNEWVSLVKLALPNIESIKADIRPDDGCCYLSVGYKYGEVLNANSLSHGTLCSYLSSWWMPSI